MRVLLSLVLCFALAACETGSDEPRVLPTLITFEDDSATATAQLDGLVGLLDFWVPASHTLVAGEQDHWGFIAQANDAVTIRVIGLGSTVRLTLVNEADEVLAADQSLVVTLLESGPYTVIVENTTGEGGDYEIGLGYSDRPNPQVEIPTLVPELVGVPTPTLSFAELGTFITRLSSNNTVSGTFDEGDSPHVYAFEGQIGQYVQVEMNRVNGEIDPVITLYNIKNVPMALDDDSADNNNAILRNILLPEDGLYSVQANGRGLAGDYTIRLLAYDQFLPVTPTVVIPITPTSLPPFQLPTLAPSIPGNQLESYKPVLNILPEPTAVGIHTFTAFAGDVMTIGVSSAQDIDQHQLIPAMEISDPEGVIVGSDIALNALTDAVIANLRIELDGVYTVFVRGEELSFGAYVISYGIGSTRRNILKGEAPFGERNESEIVQRGFQDVWTLELKEGDVITAATNPGPNSQLDPILELVRDDETETVIAIDDNGGGNLSSLIRSTTIPETGRYVLRVRASQAQTTGAYALIWRYITVAPTPTPPPAVAPILNVDDVIETSSEYRFYPFWGFKGQRVYVRVLAVEESGLDPVAALIGPDGTELMLADDSEGDLNARFEFELPEDGTYNVRVNGYLTTGPFIITVEELVRFQG